MRITGSEILHCNAGWRDFSFLKLNTAENNTGIAEFNECYGSPGLSGVIRRLVDRIKDMDAIAHERIHQYLYAATRQAPGGVNQQAIATIENALLDIKGKAFNVPVYDLLGGAIRQEIPVYWSHCGTYLIRPEIAELCGVEPLQTIDDLIKLGRRVSDGGYTGLKTNMITFDQDGKIGRHVARKIFEHCIGDGKQDFRWLSMLATKRYAASYKPNGRLRQREYAIGSRSENMPQKVYLDNIRAAMGFSDSSLANVQETTLLCEALQDGDDVYVHFRKGVPLGLFVGREDSKVQGSWQPGSASGQLRGCDRQLFLCYRDRPRQPCTLQQPCRCILLGQSVSECAERCAKVHQPCAKIREGLWSQSSSAHRAEQTGRGHGCLSPRPFALPRRCGPSEGPLRSSATKG